MIIKRKQRIVADDEAYSSFSDHIDDIANSVDEIQNTLDDIEEDEVDIELDNNIENHYIAECDRCHGIFISALAESDQDVTKVSGICPLCSNDTDQYLKWIIKSV